MLRAKYLFAGAWTALFLTIMSAPVIVLAVLDSRSVDKPPHKDSPTTTLERIAFGVWELIKRGIGLAGAALFMVIPMLLWYASLRLLNAPDPTAKVNAFFLGFVNFFFNLATLVFVLAVRKRRTITRANGIVIIMGVLFVLSLAVLIWGFSAECYSRIPGHIGGGEPIRATLVLKRESAAELEGVGLRTRSTVDVLFETDKLVYISVNPGGVYIINADQILALNVVPRN